MRVKTFLRVEHGAVSVDWITLIVIVIGLALFAVDRLQQMSEEIATETLDDAAETIARFRTID